MVKITKEGFFKNNISAKLLLVLYSSNNLRFLFAVLFELTKLESIIQFSI